MSAQQSPPPAWYPDPSGRFEYRWFDGTRWTDQVSAGGAQRTDVPATQAPPAPSEPTAGIPLFTEPVLVAHQHSANRVAYDLLDQHGAMVARSHLLNATTASTSVDLALLDPGGAPLLHLFRPQIRGEEAVYVRDGARRDVGRLAFVRPKVSFHANVGSKYHGKVRIVLQTLAGQVAEAASDDADLVPVLDLAGRLVATVSRGGSGLAAVVGEDEWVLQRHEETAEPLRSLIAALPVAMDLLLEQQVKRNTSRTGRRRRRAGARRR